MAFVSRYPVTYRIDGECLDGAIEALLREAEGTEGDEQAVWYGCLICLEALKAEGLRNQADLLRLLEAKMAGFLGRTGGDRDGREDG